MIRLRVSFAWLANKAAVTVPMVMGLGAETTPYDTEWLVSLIDERVTEPRA